MIEPDHVCVHRPCLLCALDRGDPLPPGTRLVDSRPRKILSWPAREEAPDITRLAAKLTALSPELRGAVEEFVDELGNYCD